MGGRKRLSKADKKRDGVVVPIKRRTKALIYLLGTSGNVELDRSCAPCSHVFGRAAFWFMLDVPGLQQQALRRSDQSCKLLQHQSFFQTTSRLPPRLQTLDCFEQAMATLGQSLHHQHTFDANPAGFPMPHGENERLFNPGCLPRASFGRVSSRKSFRRRLAPSRRYLGCPAGASPHLDDVLTALPF